MAAAPPPPARLRIETIDAGSKTSGRLAVESGPSEGFLADATAPVPGEVLRFPRPEHIGSRSAMTSGCHPQPDAAESVNRLALRMLRTITPALANRWDEVLDLFEFALNNSDNSGTGVSAFMLGYGHHPRTPLGEWTEEGREEPSPTLLTPD
ncbi:hypothetical protein RI054_27g112830 [Pseudoscourfieldia marina]